MKLIFKALTVSMLIFNITFCPESSITMFLQKYPYFKMDQSPKLDPEKYSKKLKQPGYLYGHTTKEYFWHKGVPGIICLYAGNLAISDKNGLITLPNLQQRKEIYILVTQGIGYHPDYIIGPSTIHNWSQQIFTLDPDASYQAYLVKLHQDDKLELSYFDVQKSELPHIEDKESKAFKNGRYIIPLNTIIFISAPKDIFIPEGATLTEQSPNLNLPPIYIKRDFCFVGNSLYNLAIKQYFRQIEEESQLENLTVSHIIQS
jgi:hypothetical protein